MRLLNFSIVLLVLFVTQNGLAYELKCEGSRGLVYQYSHNDGGAAMRPYEYLKVNGIEYIASKTPTGTYYKVATFTLDKKVASREYSKGFYTTTEFTAMGLVKLNTATVMPVPLPVQCKETVYHGPPRPSPRH